MASFGLTGGIASGKSTVAAMLGELGAKVIDADQLGHEELRPGAPAFPEIVRRFGREVLAPSGEIDRRRLGAIVFADSGKLAQLNAIVHPAIMARSEEMVAAFEAQDPAVVVVVDAALIFEAHMEDRFLKIIVAWCRPEQQLQRLMAKAGLTREEAERRIGAQMSAEEKRRRAEYVIDCSGSLRHTREQVAALYPKLKSPAQPKKGEG